MNIKTKLNRKPKLIFRAVKKLTRSNNPKFNNPWIETVWVTKYVF